MQVYEHHIIHTLHAHGYTSALCGVQHIARKKEDIGYHSILPCSRGTDRRTAAVQEFFKQAANSKQPFFLSVGFGLTHRPFPEDKDGRYCRPPLPLPDTPETRRDMAGFINLARQLDTAYGEILGALEQAGLTGDTMVICTTDHGMASPKMKCTLTDHGTGVMLIMAGPGGFDGGRVCDGLVSQVDIFPTICDMLDIEKPDWLEGISLMPLVRGEKEQVRDAVFTEQSFHCTYEPMRAIRTQRYKYIRRFDSTGTVHLPNCDPGLSKNLLVQEGWPDQPVENEELYDLVFDPTEACNRINDPALQDVLFLLRNGLQEWMHQTDDPLLEGAMIPPSGALVSDPTDIEPGDIWKTREQPEGYA
jgi:arylsulfatase A-like enzyme